jgi:hypothetical protein
MLLVSELFASSVLPQCVLVFCHIVTACSVLYCYPLLSQSKQHPQGNIRKNSNIIVGITVAFYSILCLVTV